MTGCVGGTEIAVEYRPIARERKGFVRDAVQQGEELFRFEIPARAARKTKRICSGGIPRARPIRYPCDMGKLAERYQDAAKSGVYRVASAEIPLRAAEEAFACVLEIGAAEIPELAGRLQGAIAEGERRPHVVLLREGGALAQVPQRYAAALDALERLARDCRARALPLFVVLVDPGAALDLPRLYKEHAAV
jgi:hypothetical protein